MHRRGAPAGTVSQFPDASRGAQLSDPASQFPGSDRLKQTFLLEPRLANAGVSKIPKTFVINGNAGTLLARYLAGAATTTTWAADVTGPTLTAGGGTIAPAPDSPSPWEDGEGSVFIDDSDSGDILTGAVDDNLHTTDEDLVIEGVFWRGTPQTSGGAGMQITLGRDFGTGGWTVRAGKAGGGDQAPVIQFQATKTGAVSPVVRCSHPEGTWVHVVFVYSPALGRSIVFCGGARIDDQAINLITDLDIAPGAPLIFNRYGAARRRLPGCILCNVEARGVVLGFVRRRRRCARPLGRVARHAPNGCGRHLRAGFGAAQSIDPVEPTGCLRQVRPRRPEARLFLW